MSISEAERALFRARGWLRLGPCEDILAWTEAARPQALAATRKSTDRRCGGTWMPGVDALGNDPDGGVAGVPFPARLSDALHHLHLTPRSWHKAQVSAVLPGYPKPGAEETEGAARFRLRRDAAHLDGLLPVGPDRRRKLREPHGFILGIPLTEASAEASPLVVWEGSHVDLQEAISTTLRDVPQDQWQDADLTEVYQTTRARIFETRPRVPLPVQMGEATLLHRHLLHGVAPWGQGATADPEGRIIAYLRPELDGGLPAWGARDA